MILLYEEYTMVSGILGVLLYLCMSHKSFYTSKGQYLIETKYIVSMTLIILDFLTSTMISTCLVWENMISLIHSQEIELNAYEPKK